MQDVELHIQVVQAILEGNPERALRLLSSYYGIITPDLRVGTVKRHRRVLGCYLPKEKRIYVSKSEYLSNPLIILHEFYHHLRSFSGKKRQAEKRADQFANSFIDDFIAFSRSHDGFR
jgi:hypothetical protein